MRMVFLLPLALLFFPSTLFSQGVWTQKADFGGGAIEGATGFSIDTKGYIAITRDTLMNFWEWDQTTNVWIQKANFPGDPRGGAVGFSIGNKGYVGTGGNGNTLKNDFWEFDPTSNSWLQQANFAGTPRYAAVGFSIGKKGYLGTGYDSIGAREDFWEWDGDTSSSTFNTWTQKANYAGGPLSEAIGFSIGTKGYVGMGAGPSHFWEWDQSTNLWTKKANTLIPGLILAVSFSIGANGYVGTGVYMAIYTSAFVSWDQNSDTWISKASFINPRQSASGFSIGSKGYIGMGVGGSPSSAYACKDFWEFDPNGNSISEAELSNSITTYPSPTSGKFSIQSLRFKVQEIKIFDSNGKLVEEEPLNIEQGTLNCDLSSEPNGIYFLKIKTEEGIVTKKVILNK